MKTCAVFGHSKFVNKDFVGRKLKELFLRVIELGVGRFLVGSHGETDRLALGVLIDLKKEKPFIIVEKVVTTIKPFKKDELGVSELLGLNGVGVFSYEIENIHFKRRITYSNFKMIDESDFVVCYLRKNESCGGVKFAIDYAKKHNKQILNVEY